jgi:hypothetical protein
MSTWHTSRIALVQHLPEFIFPPSPDILLGTFYTPYFPFEIYWYYEPASIEGVIEHQQWRVDTFLTWEDTDSARYSIRYVTLIFPVTVHRNPLRFEPIRSETGAHKLHPSYDNLPIDEFPSFLLWLVLPLLGVRLVWTV